MYDLYINVRIKSIVNMYKSYILYMIYICLKRLIFV